MTKLYLCAGNTMIDNVAFYNGGSNKKQLGGPAVFAYTGIKLWTDNVKLLSNVGKDLFESFSEWLAGNDVDLDYLRPIFETTTVSDLEYLEDGTYQSAIYEKIDQLLKMENLGFMKVHPWQIEEYCKNNNLDGLYIAQNNDAVFWDEIYRLKNKYDFKVMWEIEEAISHKEQVDKFYNVLKAVDIFSINIEEAQNLFGIKDEKEVIRKISQLDVDATVFRVGARGLYTISKDQCLFHPSIVKDGVIDATGSGNSSTASALYSYVEQDDLVMIGTKSNIASSVNLKHFGAVEKIKQYRDEAEKLASKVYSNYDFKDNDYSWWLK